MVVDHFDQAEQRVEAARLVTEVLGAVDQPAKAGLTVELILEAHQLRPRQRCTGIVGWLRGNSGEAVTGVDQLRVGGVAYVHTDSVRYSPSLDGADHCRGCRLWRLTPRTLRGRRWTG